MRKRKYSHLEHVSLGHGFCDISEVPKGTGRADLYTNAHTQMPARQRRIQSIQSFLKHHTALHLQQPCSTRARVGWSYQPMEHKHLHLEPPAAGPAAGPNQFLSEREDSDLEV